MIMYGIRQRIEARKCLLKDLNFVKRSFFFLLSLSFSFFSLSFSLPLTERDNDPEAVNSQNDAGYTALHHAAKHGTISLIQVSTPSILGNNNTTRKCIIIQYAVRKY